MTAPKDKRALRSRLWFDDPSNPGMTALYLERYLNFGLTRHELQSGRPMIGIAQSACQNRRAQPSMRPARRAAYAIAGGQISEP
jgi:hypothetical protein